MMQPDPDDHDRGLQFDVSTLLARRRMLGLLAGVGVTTLLGCVPGSDPPAPSSAGSAPPVGPSATAGRAEEIPAETAGPYPGDGSNGPNVLAQSGIVRSDIRSSFGSASGVAGGVPLTINLTVLEAANAVALAGAAVYVWHCDRELNYSMYSPGARNENYLRGVQETDAAGLVRFTSIFPGAYLGRWPHVHLEVYRSLADATSSGNKMVTSQLALPEDVCNAVYATDGYGESARNLPRTPLDSDLAFRDDYSRQLATVTGSVSDGYAATLSVPV